MGLPVDAGGRSRELDYEAPDVDYVESSSPSTTAAEVGTEVSRTAWAAAAREVLIETARSYHAVVTSKVLAETVQHRSLITTDQRVHYWIGDVLGRVAKECTARGEPLLSALCVDATGSVAGGYDGIVKSIRGEAPSDGDLHAAIERFECYRRFGAKLPTGGGRAALTPELKDRRDKARAVAKAAEPAKLCPIHSIQLPVHGVCDLCE